MAACSGIEVEGLVYNDDLTHAVRGMVRKHCACCRDAAPPVLTEQERQTVARCRARYDRDDREYALGDRGRLLKIIDRLTGGEGGSRG